MSFGAKLGLSIFIGIIGAEIASAIMVYLMGAPARFAFNLYPVALIVRLFDPITLAFVLVFFGLGWACLPRRRAF